MNKCLMIDTPDHKLFTSEENYPSLIEFSRALGAEVSLVEFEGGELCDMSELASKLCSPEPSKDERGYEVIQTKIPRAGRPKKLSGEAKALDRTGRVTSFIEAEFLVGNEVCFKNLKSKFKNYNINDESLSDHLQSIKKSLSDRGYNIQETMPKTYRVILD